MSEDNEKNFGVDSVNAPASGNPHDVPSDFEGATENVEDGAFNEPGDEAALGTPVPIEADRDESEVERLAKEHYERNTLEKVNRAGYSPDAPHPSEREPNQARRTKNDE